MLALMQFLQRSFSWVLVAGMVCALLLPRWLSPLAPAVLPLLAAMIFLGGLKLDVAAVTTQLRRPWRLAGDVALQMFVLPVLVYALMRLIDPRFALGAMAVAACPAATSSPAVTGIFRGCVASALLLLLGTSLISPLSLPLVLSLGAEAGVELDVLGMMRNLSLVIVLPLLAAILLRWWRPGLARRVEPYGGGAVTLMLALVCAVPLAGQAEGMISLGLALLWPLSLAFGLMGGQLGIGWLLARRRSPQERRAMALSLCFKNIALTMALAAAFFDADSLLFCSCCLIPWVVLLGVFKRLNEGRRPPAAVRFEAEMDGIGSRAG
jgi:BASS family bile acid:Na+ symporter